jgi:hypothetical protein
MRRTLKIAVLGAACACHALRQSLPATSSTLQHKPVAAAATYEERSSQPMLSIGKHAHAIEVRSSHQQQQQQQQHILSSLLQTAAKTAAALLVAFALLYPGVSSARLEPLPPPKSYGQQMTEAIPIKTVRFQLSVPCSSVCYPTTINLLYKSCMLHCNRAQLPQITTHYCTHAFVGTHRCGVCGAYAR